jgi:histidinol dehydrogenase
MIEWITTNQTMLMNAVTTVIAACAAIAALTPTHADNQILDKILGFVNLLGLNVGRATNSDDAG